MRWKKEKHFQCEVSSLHFLKDAYAPYWWHHFYVNDKLNHLLKTSVQGSLLAYMCRGKKSKTNRREKKTVTCHYGNSRRLATARQTKTRVHSSADIFNHWTYFLSLPFLSDIFQIMRLWTVLDDEKKNWEFMSLVSPTRKYYIFSIYCG